ncbi:MAG: hypothetical protein IE931_05645 [Sphingobacteriales bacterium]|nr:hypothetical protein [Sphingobacteriales bacterium]
MSKVITFSRVFPKYHPKAGKETFFVEQLINSLGIILPFVKDDLLPYVNDFMVLAGEMQKHHTIRAGKRFKAGDYFSPRIWSGKPYNSKQIKICDDVLIKKTWDIEINNRGGAAWFEVLINGEIYGQIHHGNDEDVNVLGLCNLAQNDGLSLRNFQAWFSELPFQGQIICWSDQVDYN